MGEEIGFSEEVVEVEADRRHIDVWLCMNTINQHKDENICKCKENVLSDKQ